MFVLGVDPGVSRCGYGCVESARGQTKAIAVGVLTTPPSQPLPERLAALDVDIRELLVDLRPDDVDPAVADEFVRGEGERTGSEHEHVLRGLQPDSVDEGLLNLASAHRCPK